MRKLGVKLPNNHFRAIRESPLSLKPLWARRCPAPTKKILWAGASPAPTNKTFWARHVVPLQV